MTWRPHPLPPVPEATAAVVNAAFPKGNLYVDLRTEFGTLYDDTLFAVVYGIFREFSRPLFKRFQKPEISKCYGPPFSGKNEFAKKVIHYRSFPP
jgi:hypothetical protein